MMQSVIRFLDLPWVVSILESRLGSYLISHFVVPFVVLPENYQGSVWSTNKKMFVFLISYAATEKGLTAMSRNATFLAGAMARKYNATVIACEFFENPIGAKEWAQKQNYLLGANFIYAGDASNTIDEMKALTQTALTMSTSFEDAIVVGNGLHIKRASKVWRHYNPLVHLNFMGTDFRSDDDLTNPMSGQRRWQTWAIINLLGILAYEIIGIERIEKMNLAQPTNSRAC